MKTTASTVLVIGIIILITIALGNMTTSPQHNPEPSPESIFEPLHQQLSLPQDNYNQVTSTPELLPAPQEITLEDCAYLQNYCAQEASPDEQSVCQQILSGPCRAYQVDQ